MANPGYTDNVRLVIFDLDGTLINAYPAIIESVNYVLGKFGYGSKDDTAIRRAVGWGDRQLLSGFVAKKDLNKALRLYRRYHRRSLIRYASVFPGVYRVLRYLKNKNYKLAVASNRPTLFSRILMRHLKLGKYFDYLLCADKVKKGKPSPDILNRIIRKLRVRSSQAIYVGDMVIDIQAARRARLEGVIIVPTGSSTRREILKSRPDIIIKDIRDILKIL